MLKTKNEICSLLSLTPDGLNKLIKKDKNFPRPIKFGNSRQSHAFFDLQEVIDWVEFKKAEREEV